VCQLEKTLIDIYLILKTFNAKTGCSKRQLIINELELVILNGIQEVERVDPFFVDCNVRFWPVSDIGILG